MRNYVQAGANLTLPAPYALDSGDGALVGSIFGVAAGDAENGADVDLVTEGVFDLPKQSAEVITLGSPLYWDNVSKEVTADQDTADSFTRIGVAVAGAGNGATTVRVRLNGSF